MAVYKLQKTQFIPVGLEEAWDFFFSPEEFSGNDPRLSQPEVHQ
jgi:hypothetical protein